MVNVYPEPWPELQQRRENYLEKPLPSSDESERVILGAILLDNEVIVNVVERLKPEDFYSPFNRRVYSAVLALFAQHKPIDPILIGEEMKKEGNLEAMGGVTAIANLTFGLPHFSNIEEYVVVVKDKAKSRNLIRLCNHITQNTLAEEDHIDVVLDQAEAGIYALRGSEFITTAVRMEGVVQSSIETAQLRAETGTTVVGVPTGFTEIDTKLQGLRRKQYIVLAARPRIGKTALIGRILYNVSTIANAPTLLFSLEMAKEEIADRIICAEANIDSYFLRAGHLTDQEWIKAAAIQARLTEKAGFYINDNPIVTTTTIRAEIRRVNSILRKEDKQLEVVAIDHVGLVRNALEKRGRTREGEVSEISKDLKAVAREFDCVVAALSQLNRQSENQADHTPMMSHLRESGSLEQDADVVALLAREDVYQKDPSLYTNIAEFIIGKNRNGPEGLVKLHFARKSAKFSDLSQVADLPPEPIYQPGDIIL